jgi:hypothetical protein
MSDRYDAMVPQVERIYQGLVHLQFAEADRATRQLTRYDAATGFLVNLGGRAFVFTAKHNLENETPRTMGVAFPRLLTIGVRIGEGVRRIFRTETDVDAAVLELDPGHGALWKSAKPFERREFGTLEEPRSTSALCLCGFPAAETKPQTGFPVPGPQYAHLATMLLVDEVPGRRSSFEPSEGRGIHVRYGGRAYDHTLKIWREVAAPKGISGGPLVAINSEGVRVLGVARSIEDGAEWCEPAIECARLLVQHEDPAVAAEALALVTPPS